MDRSPRGPRPQLVVCSLLLAAGLAPLTVRAAVFTPTTTADTLDGACDFQCSLREAIVAANASPGPDVVVLEPGIYGLTRAGAGEDQAASGDLDVSDDLVLLGAGADQTTIHAGALDRVLDLAGARLEIVGVTLRGGSVAGDGGGLRNDAAGTLLLTASVVVDSHATGFGGGISSAGTLVVTQTTLSGNTATAGGGGIAADVAFTLTNSTLSANQTTGAFGGGLYLFADLDGAISNSTVTGNQAAQRGGGAFVETAAFIGESPGFRNSILAGNTSATEPDCSGAGRSEGYNLVGIGLGCGGFSAANHDLVGTGVSPVLPALAALAPNGGTSPTHALLPGSPAIGAGNPAAPGSGGAACEPVDQRGARRPGVGKSTCDIGAVETTTACVDGGTELCLNAGRFRVTAVWTTPPPGTSGKAIGVRLTDDSGYFWFFGPENLELTVKVLDACSPPFNRFWVFLSGLTNVQVVVTVTDTATGAVKVYNNPQGRPFPPLLDTNAFATCP